MFRVSVLVVIGFTLLFESANTRNVYYSLDGAKDDYYSKYIQNSEIGNITFITNKADFSEKIAISEANNSIIIDMAHPVQDIKYSIRLKNNLNNEYEYFRNISIQESCHSSNIFYDKYKYNYSLENFLEKANILNDQNNIFSNNSSSISNNFLETSDNSIKDKSNNDIKLNTSNSAKVDCKINFTGLKYLQKKETIKNEFAYHQVINFYSLNLILYKEIPGIFIEKHLEGMLKTRSEITAFLNNNQKGLYDFSNLKIKKILTSFHLERNYLFVFDEALTLYVIRLNANESDIIADYADQISFFSFNVINKFQKVDLEKLDLDSIIAADLVQENSNFFLIGKNAINWIYFDDNKITNLEIIKSFNETVNNNEIKEINLDILDAAFVNFGIGSLNKGLFLAVKDYGLVFFLERNKAFKIMLKHPRILKLDKYPFDKKNLGLYFNNTKDDSIPQEDSREFFVELLKYPLKLPGYYDTNKIFYNQADHKIRLYEHNLFDALGNVNFFIDKISGVVYYIKRNMPYSILNIDAKFPLPEEAKNLDFEYFNIVSMFKKNIAHKNINILVQGMLVLQIPENHFIFYQFLNDLNSTFVCQINDYGEYSFEYFIDTYEKDSYTAFERKIFVSYIEKSHTNELSFFVIAIIVFIIALIMFIGYYFIKKCKEIRKQDNYRFMSN